ncbi:MAG TPA: aminotransferase class IV [Solirubrobacteraceae bacterium]|jgi:branched-chain amino acid aminotransferase
MPSPQAGCISVNGRLFAPHEATVSALDAGFLLGDGLFESLRATGGAPYLLDRHLARLLSAAREMEFENMPSAEELAEQVQRTLEQAALTDAYVRVTVTRGSGATALAPPASGPTVVIAALHAPARVSGGVEATLLGPPSERGATAKSTSRQQAVLARRRVEKRGAAEGLYVSQEGYVLEGVSSNLFVVSGGRLLTPPAEHCLPGITRGRVLELAVQRGVEVAESPVEVDLLMGAEEVFVTNAVQGLRRLSAIDGTNIGVVGPDGVLVGLMALYDADRTAVARI